MLHTFEISKTMTNRNAIILLNEFYDKETTNKILAGDYSEKTLPNPLSIPGLSSIEIKRRNADYFTVKLVIEPHSLLAGRPTINVFDCLPDSVERLRPSLDAIIKEIHYSLPNAEKWRVSRADWTMNLISEHVALLIKLAKRGKDPYRFSEANYTGSSYRRSKSVKVCIYDKMDWLLKKTNLLESAPYLLNEAKNILRVEIQCESRKLGQIKKKYNLPAKANIFDFMKPNIAESVIRSYYDRIIGAGDFYSLDEAVQIIMATGWRADKKDGVINFLKLIAQARNVGTARRQFIAGTKLKKTEIPVKGSFNTFDSHIKSCRQIGLNPITIPREWKIDHIANPMLAGA